MQFSQPPQFSDIPARSIAYVASCVVIGFCVFAFFCQVELKKDVSAEIVAPGEVKIERASGLVSQVFVAADTPVSVGTPLFTLERDLSLAQDGSVRSHAWAREQAARLETVDMRAAVVQRELDGRIASLTATLATRRHAQAIQQQEIAQAQLQIERGAATLARLQAVAPYVEVDRIERAEADLAQRRTQLAQRRVRQGEIATDIGATRSAIDAARAELARLELEQRHDRQDVRAAFEKSRSTVVVASPIEGVVSFSQLMPGRYLRDGEIAMTISATGQRRLQAMLRIPSRQRGFMRAGQVVRLKFDAFPYARFGTLAVQLERLSDNTVASAGPAPDAPGGLAEHYLAYAVLPEPFFTVRGQRHEILAGMRATAAVVVERRSIAEWLLPPLFEAMRG
ncbi:HlyD family secretion protein [Herbaspirillum sp. alder98]|uniref:HlyD family secretion protein n=1 Tax=Herbaspirillum sp. alder98 TaxID=2913096 RepID=UPI001CD90B09|nr:HlyD family efflux transporter periplasmic adaptor subunit [Herbaspirillum sp. alder98]MCA1326547.1 HlyD family secretion protein [Herbaspirillum sp. alder98]